MLPIIQYMIKFILEDYKSILQDLNGKCEETQKGLPVIPCPNKCFDCCKQIFPLNFIEAYYLSVGFHQLPRNQRRTLQQQAEKNLNLLAEFESSIFNCFNTAISEVNHRQKLYTGYLNQIQTNCPFLDEGSCSVYEFRNHSCRAHGYSYDFSSSEIVACFRYSKLFPNPEPFIKKAVDYNYRFPEIRQLEQQFLRFITGNTHAKQLFYLTNPFIPLLKDYSQINWKQFFNENIVCDLEENNHSLLIDHSTYEIT